MYTRFRCSCLFARAKGGKKAGEDVLRIHAAGDGNERAARSAHIHQDKLRLGAEYKKYDTAE